MNLRLASIQFVLLLAAVAHGQSNDQNFPTRITSNELNGSIKARDIGDARLTTHFYVFEGTQGDIFINVVAKNFTGDIDIFLADDMRPLAKMIIYAEVGVTENGRLIYLRKPERLMLRVEGRSPGDDPATYQIKFGGSFVAMAPVREEPPPTIIEEKRDVNTSTVASREPNTNTRSTSETEIKSEENVTPSEDKSEAKVEKTRSAKPVVVVEEFPGPSEKYLKKPEPKADKTAARKPPVRKRPPPKPDPLANVHLVITMKDGSIIEHVMSEVQRFMFDRGVLTVTSKKGKITSYNMTDIANVNLQ